MARRAVLGGGSLNPFGGSGADFGAFNIGPSASQSQSDAAAAIDRAARLELNRKEIEWNAGRISNAEYLAALAAYGATADQSTSTGQDAAARVDTYRYRFERDAMVAGVESGSRSLIDLLNYDRSSLSGLVQDSEEYQQRLDRYQSTQGQLFSQYESELVDQYNKGQMTTAQLNESYLALGNDPLFTDSLQIRKSVEGRLSDLQDRVLAEKDSKVVNDYQAGKITPAEFIAYGSAARGRYAPGTEQFNGWTERLTDASDRSRETALLYRYDLSQKYAQLQKFIQSSKAPTGGTSTSTQTRTVLQADGTWKTVKTTSSKATAPSKSEVAAYAARQVEVESAKAQLAQIEAKLVGVGGYVSTPSIEIYYQRQLGKFAAGSDEWYAVQGKLDDLADRKAEEALLRSQGIRISYPKPSSGPVTAAAASAKVTGGTGGAKPAKGGGGGGSGTTASDTSDIGLDQFMAAIAKVESGGRYTARNKSSGAYGKYQIMPANWAGWAKKYLGDASAAQTPENQEKVVRGKMGDLYKWLGDYRAVAHWWLTGGSKDNQVNPAAWSSSSRRYVDNVMAGVGRGPTSGSSLTSNARAAGYTARPRGGSSNPMQSPKLPAAAPAAKPTDPKASGGPLRILAGVDREVRSGEAVPLVRGAGFPTGLDSEAFKKFYAQYQGAYQSGSTEFSVATGSGTIHYWVGDDVVERRDLMRGMDELRVNMFREQMVAYAGTGSAATKANQFDQSLEDAARNELVALATVEPSGRVYTARYSPNPLAQGLTVLDKAKAAIADYTRLAEAAFKRGDVTVAYSYSQLATERAVRTDATLKQFAQIAERDAQAIETAFGTSREEALGADKSKAFQGDLDRLNNFGLELDIEVNKGDKTLTELLKVVRKDARGEPQLDSEGPGGQLTLDPRYHWEVKPSGDIEAVPTAVQGIDFATGKPKVGIDGKVFVDYLVGQKTVPAYVDFQTGDIGWLTDATGKRIPVQGKFYNRQRPDGSNETWYEDPFTGQWSSTPVAYKPGSGFAAVQGKDGKAIIQFTGSTMTVGARGGQGQKRPDGYTYSMSFDEKTGTYIASRSRPGAFLRSEVADEVLGSVRPGQEAFDTFLGAGFARDLTGLADDDRAFAQLSAPFVGGTPKQYRDWKFNFQSPFKNLVGAKAQGGADDRFAPSLTGNFGSRPTPAAANKAVAAPSQFAQQADQRRQAAGPLPTLTPLKPLGTGGFAPRKPAVAAPYGSPIAPKPAPKPVDVAPVYSGNVRDGSRPAPKPVSKPAPKLTPLPIKRPVGRGPLVY